MKVALKLAACWVAFLAAMMLSGIASQILHLPMISPPDNTGMTIRVLVQLFAGALLVLGLYPLSQRIAGPPSLRALMVGGFFFLAVGVNGIIETRIFTHILDGRIPTAILFYVFEAIFIGAALGFFFGETGAASGLPHRGVAAWSARSVAAWLGWPFVYLFFGTCVSPIVVPYYRAGIAGLFIPSMSTILEVQLVRSVMFLVASLPLIAMYKGSRRGLWLTLGLAHAFTVGIYGLAAATFLPWVLRITHSIEITCDSFAYAGLLVLLFAAPGASRLKASVKLAASPAHPA